MSKLFKLASLLVFFSACELKKSVVDFTFAVKNAKEIIDRVNSKNNYPEWLFLKGKAHISERKNDITVSINIKNRRDSLIWISAAGPLGIEIIRAQMTKDSIYFINRINKTYFIKSISNIKHFAKSDFSFYDLQNIITANPDFFNSRYRLKINQTGFQLLSDSSSYFVGNNYRVQNAKFFKNKSSIEFALEDYQNTNNFPRKLTLKIGGSFAFTINYSKVEFNKPQKISFKIAALYVRIK